MKILIADDHAVARKGLAFYCNDVFSAVEIYECENFSQIYDVLKEVSDIDLLILDIFFGELSSIHILPNIQNTYYLPNTLLISIGDEQIYGLRAIKNGVKGYINKLASSKEICEAMRLVASGKFYLPRNLMTKYIDVSSKDEMYLKNPFDELSDREFQVVIHLINGLQTYEIVKLMELNISTVSTYKRRIFAKLKLNKVHDLFKLAALYQVDFKKN